MALSTLVQYECGESRTKPDTHFRMSDASKTLDGHSESQEYVGADCLLCVLDDGWTIGGAFRKMHWYGSSCQVTVYHFTLTRDIEMLPMLVIETPSIMRLLRAYFNSPDPQG